MKSSGPVFTRQNPFQSASRVGKTHYHPSSKQPLTKRKKTTALSPVRLNQRATTEIHTLSPEDKQSFEKCDSHFTTMDAQTDYAELWPSTECGSSPASSIASFDMEIPKQSARAGKSTVSFELGGREDSVLAKYVERFRHGRPQSREERQLMAFSNGEEQMPFWWMSPSSLPSSSTPTKTTDKDAIQSLKDDHGSAIFSSTVQAQSDRPPSPWRRSLSGEFDDTEILHLQERASRLLLRGESTLSDGSIPVSSEGLGCSDFSSPVSVDEPLQRALIPSLIKSTTVTVKANSDSVQAASSKKSVFHSLVTPTRPEEDILFQWRLRRKMEQAREGPHSIRHSTFSWQAPSLSHSSASGQPYKQQSTRPPEFSQKPPHITSPETREAHGPWPPASNPPPFHNVVSGSSVSQPKAIAHVPAHMHLLCDVLPCPVQSSHARAQHSISLTLDESQAKVACKKTKAHGNTTEEPTLEHVSSSPPASSRAVEGEGPSHHKKQERNRKEKGQAKESERIEKKTTLSIRKQKKSTRSSVDSEHSDGHSSTNSSNQRLPKRVLPWTGHHQRQGAKEFPRESCTGDHAPPPSPIHSALGQVVSEVLFPTVDSSLTQKTPVSLVSPPSTASATPQSPVPPSSAHNSVEVISQLLQEAEDSDEKEFEDDPLLQVLRKQRKWVKEQISKVDSVLNEFLVEQHIT